MSRPKLGSGKDKSTWLLIFTIAALVLSHYPLVSFGSLSGVHIELSLIYFLVVSSVAASLSLLWSRRSTILKNPLFLSLLSLVVFLSISIVWTSNPIRGILTAAFFLLVATFATVIALHHKALVRSKKVIINALTIVYALTLIWAAWQIIGDWFRVSAIYTLLPAMYGGNVFGVARPTGFALEPQFLASLLLIPIGLLVHRKLSGKQDRFLHLKLFVVSTVFFLTLSRGAYLGLVVLLVVLAFAYRASWSRYLKPLSVLMLGFFMMLLLVFLGATIRQDNISGYDALRRTVSHTSLGMLSLPEQSNKQTTSKPLSKNAARAKSTGYIKASTESRLSMSQQAINIWTKNPKNLIFGVGVGGFGTSIKPSDPSAIVNNYYLELLVETGLVGFGLFLVFLAILGVGLIRHKAWLLVSLLAGLLVQAFFFSGNANIIHLWALIGVAIGLVIAKNTESLKSSSATID